jgi:diphthine synthase
MLALIGIGLDAKDISVKALEFIKAADIVLSESYTSFSGKGALEFITDQTGKIAERTKRSDFEDNLKATVARASHGSMAILVIGDPLIATTHSIILEEAQHQGIGTAVFHAPSIFSAAIGESGLDIYRFGPTTTVPFWSERYKPASFMDVIRRNLSNSQHTLVLLDIEQERRRPMGLNEAYATICSADSKRIIEDKTPVISLSAVGQADQHIALTAFSQLPIISRKCEGMASSLIFPSKMNFAEQAATKKFRSNL